MSCIENNKFISDTTCNNEYKSNKALDLYYQPIINYCKTNDNISKSEVCKDFYDKISDKSDIYYRQKLNSFMNDDYTKWNNKWKSNGCASNLPINLYNQINTLNNDTDKDNRLKSYINNKALDARNTCYTGEAIENDNSLLSNNCIYSEDKNFKLCQEIDGNLKLYNNNKNTNKIINSTNSKNDLRFSKLSIQPDGNVVNYNLNNEAYWNTGTNNLTESKDKGVFIVMRNDGKVILYNKEGKIVKEISSIEAFNNLESLDNNTECCTANDIINNVNCENQYVKSYKVYLNDMNNYCKLNNNIIDKDLCDELFNNDFNLNDYDTLISKKKEVCLDTKNYLNNKCIQFNNKDTVQLNKQLDYCKENKTDPLCRQLYTEYKKINPQNEFVKSIEFILLIIIIAVLVVLGGGGYLMFRKKKNIQTFINKNY